MSIRFHDGPRAAGLELKIVRADVTGSFVASFAGGTVPIDGEFADGSLTFTASTTGGASPGRASRFHRAAESGRHTRRESIGAVRRLPVER